MLINGYMLTDDCCRMLRVTFSICTAFATVLIFDNLIILSSHCLEYSGSVDYCEFSITEYACYCLAVTGSWLTKGDFDLFKVIDCFDTFVRRGLFVNASLGLESTSDIYHTIRNMCIGYLQLPSSDYYTEYFPDFNEIWQIHWKQGDLKVRIFDLNIIL